MARLRGPQLRPSALRGRRVELRPRIKSLTAPWVRFVAQIVIVLALVAAWGMFTGRIDSLLSDNQREKATTETISELLARTCEVTSPAELERQGLVAECRLARTGQLGAAVPEDALPTKAGEAAPADVIPDDSKNLPSAPANTDVDRAVDAWFATHDLRLAMGYEESLRTAVSKALAANPPPRGRTGRTGRPPTTTEINAAVTAALVANPPAAGRGIESASLDGCTLNIAYSDGTNTAIGPICGPQGPAPSDSDIAAAVASYCSANGSCRGPQGPAGYPDSFTTADGQKCTDPDGDHDYTCAPADPPVGLPGTPSESPTAAPSDSPSPSA